MHRTLVAAFSSLEDPRVERNKLHQLLDIIVLTICAVISGAEGWEAIEEFAVSVLGVSGHSMRNWLKTICKKELIPSTLFNTNRGGLT